MLPHESQPQSLLRLNSPRKPPNSLVCSHELQVLQPLLQLEQPQPLTIAAGAATTAAQDSLNRIASGHEGRYATNEKSSIHDRTSLWDGFRPGAATSQDQAFSTSENRPAPLLFAQSPMDLGRQASTWKTLARWATSISFGLPGTHSLAGLPKDLRLPSLRFFRNPVHSLRSRHIRD